MTEQRKYKYSAPVATTEPRKFKYSAPKAKEETPCCQPGCAAPATWQIVFGPHPYDDYTESCDKHVGVLLGDAPLLSCISLREPVIDHLDVVVDGLSGGFVGIEGYYANFSPRPIESNDMEWVQEGPYERLRIAIPGGGVFG